MPSEKSLPPLNLNEVKAELYRKDFYEFAKAAWSEVDPSPFVESQYIEVICSHLDWVYKTGNNLIINIPPRHAKSLIVSVMFNAWVWTNDASRTFLCSTHSATLTLRDSQKTRQLIKSNWYVDLFGDVGFLPDQDVKSRFVNESHGGRQSVSVDSGVTGDGADIRMTDDPLDASDSFNQDAISKVNEWYDGTFSTRIRDPEYCPHILIMQRLAPDDLSGHLIKQGHYLLCLPFEFDPNHPQPSNTPPEAWPEGMDGDWRKQSGQILCEERFSPDFLSKLKITLGAKASGQLNQYPKLAEGDIIKKQQIGRYGNLDTAGFSRLLIRVDTAEKTGNNNAYSVFGLFGIKYDDPDLYVLDVKRSRWEIDDLLIEAIAFFNKHHNKRPNGNPAFEDYGIEEKSSGTQLIQMMRKPERGAYGVSAISRASTNPDGVKQAKKKDERLAQVSNHLKLTSGKLLLPYEPTVYTDAAWTDDFESEILSRQHKQDTVGFWDQADVTSDAGFDLRINSTGLDASQLAFM